MAYRNPHPLARTLEWIVTQTIRATLMVGLGILTLQGMITYISTYWSVAHFFSYMAPFVPPFFITRTAKRINQRRAEHDFIKDAEAIVMVSFPKELSVPALLCTCPDMVNDQTARLLNCPLAAVLKRPMLNPEYFANPDLPRQIALHLVADFACTNERGALTGIRVTLSPAGDRALPATYVLSSVLKQTHQGLKWQTVFVRTASVDGALLGGVTSTSPVTPKSTDSL